MLKHQVQAKVIEELLQHTDKIYFTFKNITVFRDLRKTQREADNQLVTYILEMELSES